MYSFSDNPPEVRKYADVQWLIPYAVEQVTVGEGEEASLQYRHKTLFSDRPPTDEDVASAIAGRLCQEVNAYINSHYDAGTQQTLQALMVMDTLPQAVKDDILTIWPWIQSALAYYYGKKAEILGAADPKIITWDFSQFDTTKPGVTLNGIMAALAA